MTIDAAAATPRGVAGGPESPWLLALHSSSECLGVAAQRLDGSEPLRLAAFPLGRALSAALLDCVESVLPAAEWPRLGRLAVATGPGGFTGTRLTVALARTLAQQLALPLDGVGSFRLIAQRLRNQAAVPPGLLWVVQELPRRGQVAALYGPDPQNPVAILELSAPCLYREPAALVEAEAKLVHTSSGAPVPRCRAEVQQPHDVAELLRCSQAAAAAGQGAPWSPVLPLYPTSPVDGGT